jgi:parvulin-like peptidyl-prolyl isomerase
MSRGTPQAARSSLAWLVAGVALGLAAAGFGLLSGEGATALPPGAAARVNGTLIAADELERLIEGLESDTRRPASDEARRRVLDRMIDEELLVQRGLALGLAASDRRVRADLTAAVIRSVVVEAEDERPGEAELRAFYAEEREFFTQPGRLHVRQIFFRVPTRDDEEAAAARAAEAHRRVAAGEAFEAVAAEAGDPPVSPLPDAPLPPTKLREYLGPTALRAVLELAPGAVAAPVRSGIGWHVLKLVEAEPPAAPPFEEIADSVRAEWVRRAGDRALRRYLDELREAADVAVAPGLP